MKVIYSQDIERELPFDIQISFEKLFAFFESEANNLSDERAASANILLKEMEAFPILREGFSDEKLLETYAPQIDRLLDILFPELLLGNEIKAVSVPFSFTTFKFSKRFNAILDAAGPDYEFKIRNFEEDKIYIMACTFIINYYYKHPLDFKRPFFYDIPDKNTGQMKHYRALFNGDFFEVIKTKDAPEVSPEAILELLDNFDNIEKWKTLFPPHSYQMKGFGLVNLFDVTQDEIISRLKANLLKKESDVFHGVHQELATLFHIPELHFAFSVYDSSDKKLNLVASDNGKSVVIPEDRNTMCHGYFSEDILQKVFREQKLLAISDVNNYGLRTDKNEFYRNLIKHNIGSIILVPLVVKDTLLGVLEFGSPNIYELNSINAGKLKDIIPVLTIAAQREQEERKNRLDAIIQENYTSIHPSVKWRFLRAADRYLDHLMVQKTNKKDLLEEITFENVYPLYGQCDIKGSSVARNKAIQQDLTDQLNSVVTLVKSALKVEKLPIYEELIFRTEHFTKSIAKGMKTGDEESIIGFLKNDITPVLEHIKQLNPSLEKQVAMYSAEINPQLNIVYKKRKEYEAYVTSLNNLLANWIDEQQEEAQQMFPHYFERYKTDGVDFNMYIGQSLVQDKAFNQLYLHNLRLWQFKLICELEFKTHELQKENGYSLDIASMILVHSNPLSIKFRMDEKQFDVDGAYNIRYEIIKKRIDKSRIKNSNERITQPNKVTIIYVHDSDRTEYLKYIHFLQSKGYLKSTIEELEVEDLQGISGLKALRVPLNYDVVEKNVSFEELLEVVKSN